MVTGVLGNCGITDGHGNPDTTTALGFSEIVKKIHELGGIAIPAHIDGPQGLLNGISGWKDETRKSLQDVIAAEYRDLHAFDTADLQLRDCIDSRAKVGGSDAHTPGDIGRYSSWVKMSAPTIGGLRLALLDHRYCVLNQPENPNVLPDFYIERLSIVGMSHCGRIPGRPLELAFNPHFNAVIGGRGSGKSTCIESIRACARHENDDTLGGLGDPIRRFLGPVAKGGVMLEEAHLVIEYNRKGVSFRIHWNQNGTGEVLEERASDGSWSVVPSDDLRGRFPVEIFSQKQMNALADDPRGLLGIVDKAIGREAWQQEWDETRSKYLQLCERRRGLEVQVSQEGTVLARLADIERDLREYEEKGHGAILREYQRRTDQERAIPLDDDTGSLSRALRELASAPIISDLPELLFEVGDPSLDELKAAHGTAKAAIAKSQESIRSSADQIDAAILDMRERIRSSEWMKAVDAAKANWAALKEEYTVRSSPIDLDIYERWVQQRNELLTQLEKIAAHKKEAETIDSERIDTIGRLEAARRTLFERRQAFLAEVVGANAYVRMDVVPFGSIGEIEIEYRELLGLTNSYATSISDQESKSGILDPLIAWKSGMDDPQGLPRLVDELKAKTLAVATGQELGYAQPFIKRLQKIFQEQPALLDALQCYWPEDLLQARYARDPEKGKFEEIRSGSAGQKAASILAFLLSYGDTPMVIDQPEDDLDNALISDLVVTQIKENKRRRQLIIVTHNPNIVVNGDAELVQVMEFKDGQVRTATSGGLEDSSLRTAVCTILEGGREAFVMRYTRIIGEEATS
jgi:energy-coupling factor transporter ATP-binding protein EcfA2